jgi:tetratricopeptide (TPR) repeat protein
MSMYGMHGIPLEAQNLYRRGIEFSGNKKPEAAVKCLRQAVTIAQKFCRAYRELGACLTRLGRQEDVAYCYAKLLRIEPDGTRESLPVD